MVSIESLQRLSRKRQKTITDFYKKEKNLTTKKTKGKIHEVFKNNIPYNNTPETLEKYEEIISAKRQEILEKYGEYIDIQWLWSKIIEETEYLISHLEFYVERTKSRIQKIESLYNEINNQAWLHDLHSNKMLEIKNLEEENERDMLIKKYLWEIRYWIYKMIKDLIDAIKNYDVKYNKKFNNHSLNKEKEEYFSKLRNLYNKCKFLEQDKDWEENFDYIVKLRLIIPIMSVILGWFKHVILDREKK